MTPEKPTNKKQILISITLIAIITAITYLPLIKSFGFIRDDWYLIWSGYTQGPQKIVEIFSTDRPVLGLIYSWTYSILGDGPLGWNIFSFIMRLLGFTSVFWILSLLWPKRNYANTLITLLVAVYPGFLQQPNANTFSNLIIASTLALISITLTLQAITTPKRLFKTVFLLLSTMLTIFYLLIAEYLVGMEAVRLILVFYFVTRNQHKEMLKNKYVRTIIFVFPNLLAAGIIVFWRIFFFSSDRPAVNVDTLVDSYSSSPFYNGLRLAVEFLKDQFEIIFGAWSIPFYNLAKQTRLKETAISLILILIVASIFLIYYFYSRKKFYKHTDVLEIESHLARDYLFLGFLCVVVTSLPVIISNRNVLYQSNWDRYTLQSSFGAALFIYGLLSFIHKEWVRITIYMLLIGIAVSTHYINAVRFRDIWEAQRQLWWQFSWRAPDLEEGTLLVGSIYQYGYEEDYELWAPANLIYYPQAQQPEILTEVMNQQTTKNILSSYWDSGATRTIEYDRDYENTLVFNIPSPLSCLHLIDGDNPVVSEYAESDIQAIAPFSKINRIITTQSGIHPPARIFGSEPRHDWCYYYQKAELASQGGDYGEVVRLGKEVKELGLKPADWYEWIPFIEGYAYTSDYKEAKKLIPIIRELPYVKYQICSNLEDQDPTQNQEALDFLYQNICKRK